jgi:hypothetical protein
MKLVHKNWRIGSSFWTANNQIANKKTTYYDGRLYYEINEVTKFSAVAVEKVEWNKLFLLRNFNFWFDLIHEDLSYLRILSEKQITFKVACCVWTGTGLSDFAESWAVDCFLWFWLLHIQSNSIVMNLFINLLMNTRLKQTNFKVKFVILVCTKINPKRIPYVTKKMAGSELFVITEFDCT